ncbi:hypothetical protein CRUP_030291, partial [Coryphaenoides rupestris]
MPQYYEDKEEDGRACSGVREDFKSCLLHHDCVLKLDPRSILFITLTLWVFFRALVVSRTIMPRVSVPVSSTLTGTMVSSSAAAMAYESHDTRPVPATNSFCSRSLTDASM